MSDILGGLGDIAGDVVGTALTLPKAVTDVIGQMVSGGELGEAQRTGMSEAAGTASPRRNCRRSLSCTCAWG